MAGVATYAVEILEEQPDTEIIVVPVGGGSGAAGTCLAARAIRRSVQVIGVQSEAAPAGYRSWQARALVEDTMNTFAEGLATRTASSCRSRSCGTCSMTSCWFPRLQLAQATRLMIEKTRNLVEPPAPRPGRGAVRAGPVRGPNVVIVCSGGNISPAQLLRLWPRETA